MTNSLTLSLVDPREDSIVSINLQFGPGVPSRKSSHTPVVFYFRHLTKKETLQVQKTERRRREVLLFNQATGEATV